VVEIKNKGISRSIQLHPSNSHYFQFDGKPIILITSAEHYGAIVNEDFNYTTYLNALKSYGLNYTRIYPGFLFEPENKFMKGNTLGPKPESIVLPWARSQMPGYVLGGNLFDLDQWDLHYFERLKNFIAQASKRSIVVEICFFNAQYSDTWPISPLYFKNNIQGIGNCDYKDAQTLKHPDLVGREEDYVRKIAQEVNQFDNVVLEICDEPIITGTPLSLAGPWVRHFAKAIKNIEKELPKKHLIAQQVEGPLGGPCDLSNDPDVSVIVAQYVWEASGEQMGGMKALDFEYGHNKPIELNETYYYPAWYKGDQVAASRVEAWEFIVGGGAGFNHLNGRYTVPDPAGDTPDNAQVCQALKNLKEFMNSFDFIKMRPDKSFVANGIPSDTYCRSISEQGEQYALYIHHSIRGKEGPTSEQDVYVVTLGKYSETLMLNLPRGSYQAEWVNPASGTIIRTEKFVHKGGNRIATSPTYLVDTALRIKRTKKS
jgi:hypothetical protein